MKNKLFIILALLMIFIIPSVIAAPPVTTVQQIDEGYVIDDTPQTYLKLGQTFQYNFFVSNLSSGLLLDNKTLDCIFYLSDSNGEVLMYKAVEYHDTGYWGTNITGNNFSSIGFYPFGTRCNFSFYGGKTTGMFIVTNSGYIIETAESVRYFIFFFIILIIIIFLSIISFSSKQVRNDEGETTDSKIWQRIGCGMLAYLLLEVFVYSLWKFTESLSLAVIPLILSIFFTIILILMFPLFIIALLLLLDELKRYFEHLERG